MIVQSFRSVLWVGAVAGAAISCYMVSLRVAAERAALERVETNILIAKRDIRSLDTELTTRGRLRQLERWNSDVLALTAPTEGQFLEGEVQLASLGGGDAPALGKDGGTGNDGGTGDEGDGGTGEDGERFMHAVAAPPAATEARTILADYKPERPDARVVKASLVKTEVVKAGAEKRAPGKLADKAPEMAKTKTKPKIASRDEAAPTVRKPAAKSGRETASVVAKKAKAKTTT